MKKIAQLIDQLIPRLVNIRRTIHRNPELALRENDTAKLVRKVLGETEAEIAEPFLGSDVVAVLHGSAPGKNITLRADMDALPIEEMTGLPYASGRPGVMHACGHDGHTTILLGTALVLNELRGRLNGSVRFVFQPGEEVAAAGRELVQKGAIENPSADAVFALHAWNKLPSGMFSSRPGPFMAAADFFRIVIHGKGGHGSRPEETVDPILTAARIVEVLDSLPARTFSALDPVVITVCRIQGGSASNVVPDRVELEGTARYFKKTIGNRIQGDIEKVAAVICGLAGATFDLQYDQSYLPVVNDRAMVFLGKTVARETLGEDAWRDAEESSMGAEDFSYYLERAPGALFWLGMGEDSNPLHSPLFDFNDQAMKPAILFLVNLVARFLNS
ncbi:MAG: amidohydrolase [Deltaproteobacteria bacterium]|nr:amidohydrolase [Deltaproteobacteria bacterium]